MWYALCSRVSQSHWSAKSRSLRHCLEYLNSFSLCCNAIHCCVVDYVWCLNTDWNREMAEYWHTDSCTNERCRYLDETWVDRSGHFVLTQKWCPSPQVRLNSLHVSSVSMIILRKTIHMLLSHTANQIQFQCWLRTLLQHPKAQLKCHHLIRHPVAVKIMFQMKLLMKVKNHQKANSRISTAGIWCQVHLSGSWWDVVYSVVTLSIKTHTGSLLTVSLVCDTGHTTVWNSQPKLKQHPEGNVMLCAAVLFAGATYSRFHQICQFIGLQVPSQRRFFRIQENFLYPAVHRAWLTEKDRTQEELQTEKDVCLIGDARCDSPGYSAKYSTDTLMHSPSNNSLLATSKLSKCLRYRYIRFVLYGLSHCMVERIWERGRF